MLPDAEGFLRPSIDTSICINCGQCTRACPILNPPLQTKESPRAFGAINSDETIRMDSTSGGVFTLLSQWVLEQNGVVYGAAYIPDFSVSHCRVDLESATRLQRWKGNFSRADKLQKGTGDLGKTRFRPSEQRS